jgi:hypothetical protein
LVEQQAEQSGEPNRVSSASWADGQAEYRQRVERHVSRMASRSWHHQLSSELSCTSSASQIASDISGYRLVHRKCVSAVTTSSCQPAGRASRAASKHSIISEPRRVPSVEYRAEWSTDSGASCRAEHRQRAERSIEPGGAPSARRVEYRQQAERSIVTGASSRAEQR